MKQGMKKFLMICGIVIITGMLLSMVGWFLGGAQGLSSVEDRVPWISFGGGGAEVQTMDVEAFSSMDLQCEASEVEFIEGKSFAVESSYDKKMFAPDVEVKKGTLYIRPQRGRHWLVDLDLGGHADTVIKIYYPKGTVFKNVYLETDMGNANLSGLQAERADISSDCGDLNLDGLVTDFLNLETSMGSAKGADMRTKGAEIESDAGELELRGTFAGTTKINCDMADCTLDTSLDKDSYAIHTEVDMGDCAIDGEDVGSTHTIVNNKAKNKINVESDSGDIEINFR